MLRNQSTINQIIREHPEDENIRFLVGELEALECERAKWYRVAKWVLYWVSGLMGRAARTKSSPACLRKGMIANSYKALEYLRDSAFPLVPTFGDQMDQEHLERNLEENISSLSESLQPK